MKALVVAIALMVGSVAITQAQDSKIAHIATQELLEQMSAFKTANDELQKIETAYDAEIKEMTTALQKKYEQYGREVDTQTDEENMRRTQEVEETKNAIMTFRQNAARDLQKKQGELLKPVIEKARETIQKVAREKGFDYVLDSTTGASGVLLADGYNLMPDVKKALGM